MWDPQHLTTLQASTACYRESFTFTFTFTFRKRKRAAMSDTSGSDADTSRSPKKKRPAVIGSASEDSDAHDRKDSADGDEKEQTGNSSHSLRFAYL
jgi:hypothetical protein